MERKTLKNNLLRHFASFWKTSKSFQRLCRLEISSISSTKPATLLLAICFINQTPVVQLSQNTVVYSNFLSSSIRWLFYLKESSSSWSKLKISSNGRDSKSISSEHCWSTWKPLKAQQKERLNTSWRDSVWSSCRNTQNNKRWRQFKQGIDKSMKQSRT